MAKPTANDDMGFLDHLEELRSRLFKGLLGVIIAIGVCAFFADFIVNQILIAPLLKSSPNIKLQNLVPYGQLTLYIQAILFSSLILSFPLIAYQLWQFVVPGLLPKERAAARFIVFFVSICFFSGVAFGYFVVVPFSLNFFATFGSPLIENNISITDYASFFLGMIFTAGFIFELPFVAYVLSKIGLLTPAFMRHYRKYAFVGIIVFAAVITPSTDALTMMLFALPMTILYELSILISAGVQRAREREEQLQTSI
jgi:sec-independent protein translocase protein TatC